MNSATPTVIQISCRLAKLVSSTRSSRRITARPRPLSEATTGSSTGSAYGAVNRTVMWAAMTSTARVPP